MTNETTTQIQGSLEWTEEAPTYCESVASLYRWSSNYEDFKPFGKFLDLIGYSEEEHGAPLQDWRSPSEGFGYMELGYLAEALMEYANRPHDVTKWITELLAVEVEHGL
jgi:hypothetical protein